MDRYVIQGGRAGADRLELLHQTSAADTAAFWDRAGVRAGFRCLDIGCGPGFLSLDLARRVGPSGSVFAVDRDAEAIALACERRDAAGITNVEFVVGDVYELALPSDCDLAYSRLLLQHLSRPADVVRAMWSAVRPSGVIAVEDADFEGGFCYPPNAGFEFWLTRYPELLRHSGGDPTSGRKLVRTFVDAGLPAPTVDVTQRVHRDGPAKLVTMMTLAEVADAMIDAGIATREEIDEAVEAMRDFAADPTTVCGGPRHFQAWVIKPALVDV